MIKLSMGYPTMEEEMRLIKERQDINPLDFIEEIISKKELLQMQDQVRQIFVDDKVLKYLHFLEFKFLTLQDDVLSLG